MGLGMPEVMLILVIALIVFGPRKLPELGKSLGQAMAQFRRASDDFKRTWEQEVELDRTRTGSDTASSNPSHSYDSSSSNDPYNPYTSDYHSADSPETSTVAQLPEAKPDHASVVEHQEHNAAAATAAVGSSSVTSAQQTEKKHWI